MSATMALVRIQLHFMKWPIAALLSVFVVVFLLSKLTDVLALGDILALAVVILVWIASAWIFGAEYVEGSRDYIATRPVSPRMVLGSKLSILLAFVFGCSAFIVMPTPPQMIVPVIVALLSLSLLTASMAVLFQDTIRGLMGGPVLLLFSAGIWHLLESQFTKSSITYYPEGLEVPIEPSFPWPSLGPIHILPIPLLLLVCLYMIYMSAARREHFLRPVIVSILIWTTFLSTLVYLQIRHRGKSALYSIESIGLTQWEVQQGLLRYVTSDHQEIRVHTLNLEDLHASPTDRFVADRPAGATSNLWGVLRDNRLLSIQTIKDVQTGDLSSQLDLFAIPDDGGLSETLVSVHLKSGMTLLEGGRLLLHREDGQPLIADMHAAEVFQATPGTSLIPKSSTSENPDLIGTPSSLQTRSGKVVAALSGTTVSVFPALRYISGSKDLAKINLYEIQESPYYPMRLSTVSVPDQFWISLSRQPRYDYARFGRNLEEERGNLFLIIAGGYLFLWYTTLQRVAGWDISDPKSPCYIGIFPIPDVRFQHGVLPLVQAQKASEAWRTSLYHRSDGSLGFILLGQGVLWLEFPALMKEAKS